MDHGALGQWLLQEAGNTVSLPLDGIILNDSLSGDALAKITQMPQLAAEAVFAFIDHDTPNSTVEVGGRQRQLIDFAVRRGLRLEVCQGAGYLRLLESYCRDGQIFVGTGRHMACLGTAGVLGLAVSEEALLTALAAGKLNVMVPEAVTVHVTGQLPRDAAWQDAGKITTDEEKQQLTDSLNKVGIENAVAAGTITEAEVTDAVEDLIMDEDALETAYEGYRYYDLLRFASHKGNGTIDNEWLAKKIASRGYAPGKGYDTSLYSRIVGGTRWFLPLPEDQ